MTRTPSKTASARAAGLTLLAALSVSLAFPPPCCRAGDRPTAVAGRDSGDGLALLGELGCASCHAAGESGSHLLAKRAPILGQVGARVTPQYLRAFLADPLGVKPGTTMPDVLHGVPAGERDSIVDSLVHFLVSLGGPIDQRSSGASLSQIARGRDLYPEVGGVACHEPFEPPPVHDEDVAAALLRRVRGGGPAASSSADGRASDSSAASRALSVPLGDLAMKTTVEALARFLEDPLAVRPSGRMPVLGLRPGDARLIAAYLLRDQYSEKEQAPGVGLDVALFRGQFPKVPDFDRLEPRIETDARDFDLESVRLEGGERPRSNFAVRFRGILDAPVKGSYRFWTISDDGSVLRIDGRVVVDNDNMHPPREVEGRVELSAGRHAIELGFMQGGGGYELRVLWQPPGAEKREPIPSGVLLHAAAAMIPRGAGEFRVDEARAARGRELFSTLGCASCHALEAGESPGGAGAKAMARLDPRAAGGCLDAGVAAGRPRFGIDGHQREALRAALVEARRTGFELDDRARIRLAMNALHCFRCHERGGIGGADPRRSDYFVYETPVDLGDEGRLPPSLDEVGAKLTPAGFEDALVNGRRYRTAMATRMPLFGAANVAWLAELLARVDVGAVPSHEPPFSSRLVDDGRRLVGRDGLGCINCHAWAGRRMQGAEGLDLIEAPRRLRADWFHALLVEPQDRRPGTRMPSSWPDGQSALPEIQDGDMHRQIDAIWAYLSVGEKGGMPRGLSPDDHWLLVPSDRPIVFRTFLDGFGAHAITVGFRERTHLAFDGDRVRTVAAWTGDFISAKPAWEGRAGRYASPAGSDVVRFPDGPTLAVLESPDDPWPADLPRRKLGATRTPPRWRFRGYRLDDAGAPTFLYSFGVVDVEETPATDFRRDAALLVRRLVLTVRDTGDGAAVDLDRLALRVAAGATVEEIDGVEGDNDAFIVDDRFRHAVSASPESTPFVRRGAGGLDGRGEVILPVRFATGADGVRRAEIELELTW